MKDFFMQQSDLVPVVKDVDPGDSMESSSRSLYIVREVVKRFSHSHFPISSILETRISMQGPHDTNLEKELVQEIFSAISEQTNLTLNGQRVERRIDFVQPFESSNYFVTTDTSHEGVRIAHLEKSLTELQKKWDARDDLPSPRIHFIVSKPSDYTGKFE